MLQLKCTNWCAVRTVTALDHSSWCAVRTVTALDHSSCLLASSL